MNIVTEKRRHGPDHSLNELQTLLQARVDTMMSALMPEFVVKTKASKALVLPDNELFWQLYSTMLEKNARTPERELSQQSGVTQTRSADTYCCERAEK
ncbi:hypothetical protein [Rahnella ecdela]|jgi:hypothetical protein|uniref:Uncharacterized protein n=1 Tax=Rahnella ecdela TaxID=2816250 RepID=A0ABS6LDJ3_9GAMM|nr:hypothetical protein [Rahnella ecdela]MBU9844830.1 hypothetical protein [Rahnella ecdela]